MNPATTQAKLPNDLRTALGELEIEGKVVKVTRPYSFELLRRIQTTLDELGGKWHRKRRHFVFEDKDPAAVLGDLIGPLQPPRAPECFLATPAKLADQVVLSAEIPHSDVRRIRILEPSAGAGDLVKAVVRHKGDQHNVQCVESDSVLHRRLIADGWSSYREDFLNIDPGLFCVVDPKHGVDTRFERILMHPPYSSPESSSAYVDHVLHALRFLAPGGRLVAILPVGFTHSTKHQRLLKFRRFVEARGRWAAIPERTLPESYQGIRCVLVTLDLCKNDSLDLEA